MLPLLLGALLLAPPAGAIAAEGETGTISGTVVAETGGLGGGEVCAKAVADESTYKCVPFPPEGSSYEITGLPAGGYKVGFWPTGNFVTHFWESGLTWKEAKEVPVIAEQTTNDIDAELEVGATIGGTVTALATGAPVNRVESCATLSEPERKLELERCAMTDAAGNYMIDGLIAGHWSVYFYAQEAEADVVSEAYSASAVDIAAHQNLPGVNQALIPGGQIAGTVRSTSTAAPLGGVLVCVTTAISPTPLGCLRTPSSGAYRFTHVLPGTFKVVFSPEPSGTEGPDSYPTQWWGGQSSFDAAAPIEITPPAIVNDIDAALITPPPAPATPTPPPAARKPPLKCKRGFLKRKVHGKERCVQRHHAEPKPRHERHRANQRAPESRP